MTQMAIKKSPRPSTPVNVPNDLAKKAAAANKENAISFLNVSIQGPGLGSKLIRLGKNDMTRYGMAIPSPKIVNRNNATNGGWDSVYPMAVPRNGPEHGVATSVVMIPLTNDPV